MNSLSFVTLIFGIGFLAQRLLHNRRQLAQTALVALIAADVMTLNNGRFYTLGQPAGPDELAYVTSAPPGHHTYYRLAADQLSSQDFGSLLGIDSVGGMPPLAL